MAELKYIPFYPGYMEDTSDLSDSEFRRLMYALCAYCEGAEQPEPLTGKEVIAYRFITRNIKVSQEQYNAKCRKNSENAKKRTITNDSERKRSQANDSQTSQYKEQRTKNKEQNIITTTTTTTREEPETENLKCCVSCYEQNIGAINRAVFDEIRAQLQVVEPYLICEAIRQAGLNNKPSWKYIAAILNDCAKHNILTRDAFLLKESARAQKAQPTRGQTTRRKTAQEEFLEMAKGGVPGGQAADSSNFGSSNNLLAEY